MYWYIFVERKSKLAKRIRKEIMKVRRKLAIQKGEPNTDLDESTQDTGGMYKSSTEQEKMLLHCLM